MITASKEFKEKLKNGANIVNYADITLSDGTVLNLTYKDFMLSGCRIDDKTTGGKFGVGYAIGKTLSIKIANYDEQYSQYDFYNSIIILYVAMLMDDGTIEKIRKGKYYATVPQTPGDIIEITAVDDMYKLDRPYTANTSYPCTLQEILSDCCFDCGIPIRFREFDNWNFTVNQRPEGLTYRQVVSYACQVAGYNARIDNDGYMDLVWYSSQALDTPSIDGGDYKHQEQPVIDGGNFADYSTDLIIDGGLFTDDAPENVYLIKSLNVHTDDVVITGVQVIFEDTEVLFGEEGYVIQVKDNPFTQGKEQEIANYLGVRMVGMTFRPFSAQILNNPLYEPFEVVRVYDRKGNMYLSIINSISYTIGSYTSISCEAEDPVRNGSQYFSAAAQAVVEARRNTEKQLTNYDKAVQNLTNLITNSFGVFKSEEILEDGSTVFYLHNKPTLEESNTIWKMTADGFAVSTDGGKTWGAGMDSDGNAVVNVLSAIGIQFDWARGGTLTLGGFDNLNGIIKIMDKNNEQVGVIDNNGIVFFSNTSKLQIVISPVTGFYQRDSEGNEFWGLSFDQTVHLPMYSEIRVNESYIGVDNDGIEYTSLLDENMKGDWQTGYYWEYQFKAEYIHKSATWSKGTTYPSGSTSVTLQLPDNFKEKEWIVSLIYKGNNSEKSNNFYKAKFSYSSLPLCYGGYSATGSVFRTYDGSEIVNDMYKAMDSAYNNLKSVAVGKVTPYLKLPDVTSGEYDISGSIPDEITEYEYDYVTDKENGTITITGKAMAGNYCVNELMDIRVLITC